MGYLVTAGAAATAVLAVVAVGTLIFKGSAKHEFVPGTAGQGAAAVTQVNTDGAGSEAPSEPATDESAPATQLTAALDVAAGEKVYAKCKACHTVDKGGANKVGPNLWSIIGRTVGSAEGFKYSKAIGALSDKAWDAQFLSDYLASPKKAIPGNKMAFAGIKKPDQRNNLIAYLAQQSDAPIAADQLGLTAAPAADSQADAAQESAAEVVAESAAAAEPTDPPEPSEAEKAEINEKVAALKQAAANLDYERARFHSLHFAPAISKARDAECLVCHQDILKAKTQSESPAGVEAAKAIAWYQTLDTYSGDQAMFHWRHMESPYAKQVMNLSCNFCHRGNDPREESADMEPGRKAFSASVGKPAFTLRKMVNPSETCLRCHGAMPSPEEIMGLGGPWHEVRGDMESEDAPNGCLSCHADTFRTVRHRVTYLKAKSIEEAAQTSSDVCYGCHGGRAWYRIAYPYPRTPWPDMDPEVPDWAKGRPTASDSQYQLKTDAAQ